MFSSVTLPVRVSPGNMSVSVMNAALGALLLCVRTPAVNTLPGLLETDVKYAPDPTTATRAISSAAMAMRILPRFFFNTCAVELMCADLLMMMTIP